MYLVTYSMEVVIRFSPCWLRYSNSVYEPAARIPMTVTHGTMTSVLSLAVDQLNGIGG